MSDNLTILLLMIVSIIGAVAVTVLTARVRQQGLRDRMSGGSVDRSGDEMRRMNSRVEVLERIVTDPAERTAREIDALR